MRRKIRLVYVSVLVGAVLLHVLSIYFGYLWWFLDLWAHMQLQFLLFACLYVGLGWYLFRNLPLLIAGAAYVALVAWWVIVPSMWSESGVSAGPLDVYFQNTEYGQSVQNHTQMGKVIASYNADIIALVESNPTLIDTIASELGVPAVLRYIDGGRSCAVFVKNTKQAHVQSSEVLRMPGIDPLCVVHFSQLDLYVVHPLPPLSSDKAVRQKAYFQLLTMLIRTSEAEEREWLVVGDFNSTRYSSVFRSYFGTYTTSNRYTWNWPSIPTIPIDHAFGTTVSRVVLYPALTSDHRGLGVVLKTDYAK